MKKIILKKKDISAIRERIDYKIDYASELNPAQYEAVMHNKGPALVIAGAGTGKTRTLIYRVARLVEDRVPPESILLLTFTRKSASEMLRRASNLLDGRCETVAGGTYHSFALQTLRKYAKHVGYESTFTVFDSSDVLDTINLLRSRLKFDKTKKRFPRKETLSTIFNLAVNRCQTIEDVIIDDFPQFMDEIDQVKQLFEEYNSYKRRSNTVDYDDLLTLLLRLLSEVPSAKEEINRMYKYVMVDEYQDTNRLQHEIVMHLAGPEQNVMAVGDDAQSIYSFRGAEFKNIMNFPDSFSNCAIFKVEENYRSTQPLLDLTNFIISNAAHKFEKELFSRRTDGERTKIVCSADEQQQSLFVVQQVLQLREDGIPMDDIAILFRSSFLSFDLEIELNRANIPYKKFGGMRFIETAHIKDLLAFFKAVNNSTDAISWHRILTLADGVGERTATAVINSIIENRGDFATVSPGKRAGEKLGEMIDFMKRFAEKKNSISEMAAMLVEFYKPVLKNKYDDWQKRQKDLEAFLQIAERYKSITTLLNDMALDPPMDSVMEIDPESKEEEFLTLSTVHSAKGLEWKAVFIIWALDGRFPSAKSVETVEAIEEERRLFYVAATRAKEHLFISYPTNVFDRFEGCVLSKPSRFLDGVTEEIAEYFVLEEE